jgi:hypothetical protein
MKNLDGNQEALKKRVTIKHQHSFANLKNNNCFCSTKANTCKDKLIKVFVEKKKQTNLLQKQLFQEWSKEESQKSCYLKGICFGFCGGICSLRNLADQRSTVIYNKHDLGLEVT